MVRLWLWELCPAFLGCLVCQTTTQLFWCTSTRHLKSMHFIASLPGSPVCVCFCKWRKAGWGLGMRPAVWVLNKLWLWSQLWLQWVMWPPFWCNGPSRLHSFGNESLSCGGTHLLCRMSNRLLAFAGTTVIFNSMLLALDKCKLPQVPKQQGKSEKLSLNS